MKEQERKAIQRIYMLANLTGLRALDPEGKTGFLWRTLDEIAEEARKALLGPRA